MREADLEKRLRVILEEIKRKELEESLTAFAKEAWKVIEPGRTLIWNWHMDLICRFLEAFYRREFRNGIINIPYRLSKSTLVSVIYPAWVWCQPEVESWQGGPGHQFLTLSHRDPLSIRDAVKTRTLIESAWYKKNWPHVKLKEGQNEKMRYELVGNGHRIAQGSKAGATGESADTVIFDDPHDAEKAQSEAERTAVTDAYDNKVSSRLNDQVRGGRLIIMQRLHEQDLSGHVLEKDGYYDPVENPGGWLQLKLPMEYEGKENNPADKYGFVDPRTEVGELLDPGRFPKDEVKKHKARLGEYGFAGQMQQNPSPKGGGILKEKWWKKWPSDKPTPVCDHVFLSWDTAFSEQAFESNAYSAMTEWGVFWEEQEERYSLILLGAWWERVAYPELRAKAKELQLKRKPDVQLIEKKASGISLVQDLRRSRIRVRTYQPDRDKVARAYAISAMLESGQVWVPERKWADYVVRVCSSFPNGAPPSADIVDTVTQALLYLRNGSWVSHPDDEQQEEETKQTKRVSPYG